MAMSWRKAMPGDADLLAGMNKRLILDEGHRNQMTVPELAQRMTSWLRTDYEAVLFDEAEVVVAYALFRRDADSVYLRQFFVEREHRRRGVGGAAFAILRREVWSVEDRVTLEVLVGNTGAREFWKAVGFSDYAIAMELPAVVPAREKAVDSRS
jgi:GNAT superfamily N-acetyltransferase